MRDEQKLKQALKDGLSGVNLTPWAARRTAEAIAAEETLPRRRAVPAWTVGLAVALAAALWPLSAVSAPIL